jgi:hypothetical protein
LLVVVASMRGLLKLDERLIGGGPRIVAAAVLAGIVSWLAGAPVSDAMAGLTQLRNEITMMAMGAIALASYGAALFGLGWKR